MSLKESHKETDYIFSGDRVNDEHFVHDYSDSYISLDPLGKHYERLQGLLKELELMNHVWTEEEKIAFNKAVGRYTTHNPIAIANQVKTKNLVQVSRRIYLFDEIMLRMFN